MSIEWMGIEDECLRGLPASCWVVAIPCPLRVELAPPLRAKRSRERPWWVGGGLPSLP